MKQLVFKKLVLGSVMSFVAIQPVWAAQVEGVDLPFYTPDTLAAVGGTATIESSINLERVLGISAYHNDFIYQYGDIKLNINGFKDYLDSPSVEAIGAFGHKLVVDKINLDVKNEDVVYDGSFIGIGASNGAEVVVGNNSKIEIRGIAQHGVYGVLSSQAKKVEVGDNVELRVTNKGDYEAVGIIGSGSSEIIVGKNVQIFSFGDKNSVGIEASGNSKINIDEKATIVSTSKTFATGVLANQSSIIDFKSGAVITAMTTTEADDVAIGVAAKENGMVIFNGNADIRSSHSSEYSFSLFAEGGSIVAKKGYYGIFGNILNSSNGTINMDLAQGSTFNGAITTMDTSQTTLSLTEDSMWNMSGSSSLTDLVNDNSTIFSMNYDQQFQTLTVNNLSGNEGKIWLGINAAENVNNSDRIFIKDTFTGTQNLVLYDINKYTPIGDEAVGSILATVNNGTGVFKVGDGENGLYWNLYELDQRKTGDTSGNYKTDWYLKSINKDEEKPTTTVESILSANALNYHTWRNENDKLLKRLGELRLNGEGEVGVWFKAQGSKISRDSGFNFANKYQSYELGYDKKVSATGNKTRYQGLAIAYTDGNSSYKRGSGDNSSKSLSFYSTDIGAKGHYLDVVVKISNMDNDFVVYDTNNKKITGDYNNIGVSLSTEYGRKNELKNGWYIEPQAQLTLGYFGGDKYTSSNGVKINQSSINSAVGRLGFNIGKEIGKKGVVYAKANLLHEFGGDYDVTMQEGKTRIKRSDSFNDTWFEYGVGASLLTSKNSYLYFDIERSAGSDFKKDWQWNIGARWAF